MSIKKDEAKVICDICEHSIGFHRFLKSAKPDACVAVFKDKDGETFCKCNKFIERRMLNGKKSFNK